jgi:hypothetical protein
MRDTSSPAIWHLSVGEHVPVSVLLYLLVMHQRKLRLLRKRHCGIQCLVLVSAAALCNSSDAGFGGHDTGEWSVLLGLFHSLRMHIARVQVNLPKQCQKAMKMAVTYRTVARCTCIQNARVCVKLCFWYIGYSGAHRYPDVEHQILLFQYIVTKN